MIHKIKSRDLGSVQFGTGAGTIADPLRKPARTAIGRQLAITACVSKFRTAATQGRGSVTNRVGPHCSRAGRLDVIEWPGTTASNKSGKRWN